MLVGGRSWPVTIASVQRHPWSGLEINLSSESLSSRPGLAGCLIGCDRLQQHSRSSGSNDGLDSSDQHAMS